MVVISSPSLLCIQNCIFYFTDTKGHLTGIPSMKEVLGLVLTALVSSFNIFSKINPFNVLPHLSLPMFSISLSPYSMYRVTQVGISESSSKPSLSPIRPWVLLPVRGPWKATFLHSAQSSGLAPVIASCLASCCQMPFTELLPGFSNESTGILSVIQKPETPSVSLAEFLKVWDIDSDTGQDFRRYTRWISLAQRLRTKDYHLS